MRSEQWRKHVIHSVVVLLVGLAALLAPTWIRYRNPPYHQYGGLDLGHLYLGVAMYSAGLIAAVVLLVKRLGNRLLVLIAAASLAVLIVYLVWGYAAARQTAAVLVPRFTGTWLPVAKDRGGLSRIVIAQKGNSWTIRVWAYATFTETDWGTVPLYLLGTDVESKSFDYGLAVWPPDFSKRFHILHIENGQLICEEYTIFIDGSGRSNYRSVERFVHSK